MAITCALTTEQLNTLYKHLYKSMTSSKDAFDVMNYMRNLYSAINAKSATPEDGPKNAAKFLQVVPRLMVSIAINDPKIAINFDTVRKAQQTFENTDTGFGSIVNTLEDNTLELSLEALGTIYQQRFTPTEIDVDTAETRDTEVIAKPSNSFTTTFQELKPEAKTTQRVIERLDTERVRTYNILKSIQENLSQDDLLNGTAYYRDPANPGVKISVKLKALPVRELLRLQEAKEIYLQDDLRQLLEKSNNIVNTGKAVQDTSIINRIALVLVDEQGNILSFDNLGQIKESSKDANPVMFYSRIAKKNNDNTYSVVDFTGESSIQTPEEIVANNIQYTLEEAKALQQKEFKELFELQEKIKKLPREGVLLDIIDASSGVMVDPKQRFKALSELGDPKKILETYGYVEETDTVFTKGQSYVIINGKKQLLQRPTITGEIADTLIAVLSDPALTVEQKKDYYFQLFPKLSTNDLSNTSKQKHTIFIGKDNKDISIVIRDAQGKIDTINITNNGNTLTSQAQETFKNALMTGNTVGKTAMPVMLHFKKELLGGASNKAYTEYKDGKLQQVRPTKYFDFLNSLNLEIDTVHNPVNAYFHFTESTELSQAVKEEQAKEANPQNNEVSKTEANEYYEKKKEVTNYLLEGNEMVASVTSRKTQASKEFITNTVKGDVSVYIDSTYSETITPNTSLTLKLEKHSKAKDGIAVAVYDGDTRVGYVRESSDTEFENRKKEKPDKVVKEFNIKDDTTTGPVDPAEGISLDRLKKLRAQSSKAQNEAADTWWSNSPLSKFISLNKLTDITNSDAFAKFIIDGSVLTSPDMLAKINLYKDGSMVDVYHEAWHGFSQLFLTKDEKKALYNEVRNSNKKYEGLSYLQIEEILAEDFRSYAKKQSVKKDSPKRNTLFRRILGFIRAFFGKIPVINKGSVSSIPTVKELYDNLYHSSKNSALLAKYKPSLENVMFSEMDRAKAITSSRSLKNTVLSASDSTLVSKSIDSIISELIDGAVKAQNNKAYILAYLRGKNRNALYQKVQQVLKTKLDQEHKNLQKSLEKDPDYKPLTEFNTLGTVKDLESSAAAIITRKDGTKAYAFLSSQIQNFENLLPDHKKGDKIRGQVYHNINIVTDFYRHSFIKQKNPKTNKDVLVPIIVGHSLSEIRDQYLNLQDDADAQTWVDITVKEKTEEYPPLTTEQINLLNNIRILETTLSNFGDGEKGVIAYHLANTDFSILNSEKYKAELEESKNDNEETGSADENNYEIDENSEDFADRKQGKKSVWQTAHPQIKYLISSLHAIDKTTGKNIYNSLGFKELVNPHTINAQLVKAISGVESPQKMYEILAEMHKEGVANNNVIIAELPQLLAKLPAPNIAVNDNFNFDIVSAFFHTYNKPEVPYKQTTFIEVSPGVFETKVFTSKMQDAIVLNQWSSKFKYQQIDNNYVGVYQGARTLIVSNIINNFGDHANKSKRKSTDNPFYFLQAIGIKLDDLTAIKSELAGNIKYGIPHIYEQVKAYADLQLKPGRTKEEEFILNTFLKDPVIALSKPVTINGKDYNNRTNMQRLAQLQADMGIEALNNGVPNAAMETVFPHIEHNEVTRIISALSKSTSFSQMLKDFKYTSYLDPSKNHYTTRLQSLTNLFDFETDGSKVKGNNIEAFMNSGTQIIKLDGTTEGMNTTDLDKHSYLEQTIHSLLIGGIQELPRHASKKTSMVIQSTGGFFRPWTKLQNSDTHLLIPTEAFNTESATIENSAIEAIILPYIAGEYARAKEIRENKDKYKNYKGYNNEITSADGKTHMAGELFTAFDDVLTADTQAELYGLMKTIPNATLEQILSDGNYSKLKDEMIREVKSYFNKLTQQTNKFLGASAYINESLLELGGTRENVIKSFVYNSWIQNFENVILVYGDMAQYNHLKEELHKRNTGATSGGPNFRVDADAKTFINDVFNKDVIENGVLKAYSTYASSIKVLPKKYTGVLTTAVIQDIQSPTSIYIKDIEDGLREHYKSIGKSKEEIEELITKDLKAYKEMEEGDGAGYISFDAYRTLKKLENDWSETQEELFKQIINKQPIPLSQATEMFPPYKLQNFGHLANADLPSLAMHKFALFPLVPDMIVNSDLQSLHDQMTTKGYDYVTFATGSKGVSISSNGKPDQIYDNGKFIEDIQFTPNEVYVEYLKKSSAVNNYFKGKISYPTQKRGLLINHLYEQGFAKTKTLEKLGKTYNDLVSEYSAIVKLELLEEVGMTYNEVTKEYEGDQTKFVQMVNEALEARDMPKHLLNDISTDFNGNLTKDLSFHINSDKIEAILTALIEKRLIKQEVTGEALVQMPASMYNGIWDQTPEVLGANDPRIKSLIGTNNLPFYNRGKKNKDGTYENSDPMRIVIALQGPFLNLLKTEYNGKEIGDIDTLNIAIKDPAWLKDNQDLIRLVGDRIPIQDHGSLEIAQIHHFLPANMSNIVVVPTEMVAKAGSDFDVDKIFWQYPEIDTDGKLITSNMTLAQLESLLKTGDKAESIKQLKLKKKAVNNALIKANADILLSSEIYSYLIKPNNTYLWQDLAKQLEKYYDNEYNRYQNHTIKGDKIVLIKGKPSKVISPTKTLEPLYQVHKLDVNMVGKDGLGVVALANKIHPILKSVGMKMTKRHTYPSGLSVDRTLMFKHNKTTDGAISLSHDYNVVGNKIADLHSHLMNGLVDVEKDAWVFYVRANLKQLSTLNYLTEAGVSEKEIAYFLSQPLTRIYIDRVLQVESLYGKLNPNPQEKWKILGQMYDELVGTSIKQSHLREANKRRHLTLLGNYPGNTVIQYGTRKEITVREARKLVENNVSATFIDPSGRVFKPSTNISNSEILPFVEEILQEEIGIDQFSEKQLLANLDKPNTGQSLLALVHYLNIENQNFDLSNTKKLFNPDTNLSKSPNLSYSRKTLYDRALGNVNVDQESLLRLKNNSILSSFFSNDISDEILKPFFKFRLHPDIMNMAFDIATTKSRAVSKRFMPGARGKALFYSAYNNAILNGVYQNNMSYNTNEIGQIVEVPETYSIYNVKVDNSSNTVTSIDGSVLTINMNKVNERYKDKAVNKTVFPNKQLYVKYILEFAVQKQMYPNLSEVEQKNKAKIFAFNPTAVTKGELTGYSTKLLSLIRESELDTKFDVLNMLQIAEFPAQKGFNILTLANRRDFDGAIATEYASQLQQLADPTVQKVTDKALNYEISEYFSIFPEMLVYQHGFGFSLNGINLALPQSELMNKLIAMGDIYLNHVEKNDNKFNLIYAGEKLLGKKEPVMSYLMTTQEEIEAYNKINPTEDNTVSQETEDGEGIIIESTQSSTSVEEGVSELFESNPNLSQIGTPQQYSQWINYLTTQGKLAGTQSTEILYHGTDQEFDSFDKTKRGTATGESYFQDEKQTPIDSLNAFFFSTDSAVSEQYGLLRRITEVENLAHVLSLTMFNGKYGKDIKKYSPELSAHLKEKQKELTPDELKAYIKQLYQKYDKVSKDLGTGFLNKYNNYTRLGKHLKNLKNKKTEILSGKYVHDSLSKEHPTLGISLYNGVKTGNMGIYIYNDGQIKSGKFDKRNITSLSSQEFDELIAIGEESYNEGIEDIKALMSKAKITPILYRVLLNVQKPLVKDFEGKTFVNQAYEAGAQYEASKLTNQAAKSKGEYDSVIFKNIRDPYLSDNYGVFEPEQVYILGGTEDIEGFKEFVSTQPTVSKTTDNPRNFKTLLPKVLYHGSFVEIVGKLDKSKKREGYRDSWHFTDNLDEAKGLTDIIGGKGKVYQIDAAQFKNPYYFGDLNNKVNSEDIKEYGFTESLLPKTNEKNTFRAVENEYPIIDEITDQQIAEIKKMGYDIIIGRGNISIGTNALEYIPLLEVDLEEVTSTQPTQPSTSVANNPTEFTNHSGGALGADTQWDVIGKEFNMVNNKHYWTQTKTPKGNTEISQEDFQEGRFESAKAAKRNFGYQYAAMKDSRLIRNWSQVKNSDAIFAIGQIVKTGEKIFPDQTNDTRVAQTPSVTGGTGYAVGMAINNNKPVFVFNQTKNSYEIGWHKWDSSLNDFVKVETPLLTKNFAGIGTRNINEAGKQAIRDVYANTFKATTQPTVEPGTDAKNALNRTLTQEELAKLRALPSLVDNVLTANKKTVASFGIKQEDWNNLSDLEKYKFLECN